MQLKVYNILPEFQAFRLFKFSKVNGINLGFSESEYGAGTGEKLRKHVINAASCKETSQHRN